MNKKRIILLSLLALIFSGLNVYADEIVITKEENKISIEAYVDKNASAVVKAVKDGYTADNYDYIYALEEETAGDDGKIYFAFYMLDNKNDISADGKYNVYVKQNGGQEQKSAFWYASAATRAQLESDLSTKALAEIISDSNNEIALRASGFAMDVYNQISSSGQADVILKVNAEITDLPNAEVERIAESFNENTAVAAANTNADTTVLKEALISAGAIDADVAMMDWIIKCVDENSPYADFAAIEKQIKVAEILSEIIDARFSQLTGLFDTYKNELGLAGNAAYNTYLSSASKEDINEDIATMLDTTKPVNAAGLISIINACLPATGGNNGGNGGGSGGSGGSYTGGSGSTGGSAVVGAATAPNQASSASGEFNDMADARWAEAAVYAMYERGIIAGDGNGKFRPNDSVKREEFVKMIIVAANMQNSASACDFADVELSSWAYSYIASAVHSGVIKGVSNTEFGFGQTLTRQDMAVICARTLAQVKTVSATREDIIFSDEADISDYARKDVHSLYCAEMINGMGDGRFAPKELATRAQAAQMIYNLFVQ